MSGAKSNETSCRRPAVAPAARNALRGVDPGRRAGHVAPQGREVGVVGQQRLADVAGAAGPLGVGFGQHRHEAEVRVALAEVVDQMCAMRLPGRTASSCRLTAARGLSRLSL